MGFLDSVLGSVLGGQQQAGSAGGGLGRLIGLMVSNPQLLQVVTGMLSNDGGHGGLGGLIAKFQQAGMGDVVGSWIGHGDNQAVSADQITEVLGSGTLADIAQKMGISPGDAADQLSSILPGLINHLTPQGAAPAGGLGNAGDLMGMLDGQMQSR